MVSKTKQTELPQILRHPLPRWKSQDKAFQAGNNAIWSSRKTPLYTMLKVITIKVKWLEINVRAKPINVYIMNLLFRMLKLMTLFFQTLFSRVLWVLQYLFTFFNIRSKVMSSTWGESQYLSTTFGFSRDKQPLLIPMTQTVLKAHAERTVSTQRRSSCHIWNNCFKSYQLHCTTLSSRSKKRQPLCSKPPKGHLNPARPKAGQALRRYRLAWTMLHPRHGALSIWHPL